MKRVIIESPYAGKVRSNIKYAKACLLDSIKRGEAPFASHLLYPQLLNDDEPTERDMGIQLGYAWMRQADIVAFYLDKGMSGGMNQALVVAKALGVIVEHRYLYSGTRVQRLKATRLA